LLPDADSFSFSLLPEDGRTRSGGFAMRDAGCFAIRDTAVVTTEVPDDTPVDNVSVSLHVLSVASPRGV
jgi:hypothetical protein